MLFSTDDLKWESMVDKSGQAYEIFNTLSFGIDVYEITFPEFIDVGKLWISQHVQREYYEKLDEFMMKHKNDPKP